MWICLITLERDSFWYHTKVWNTVGKDINLQWYLQNFIISLNILVHQLAYVLLVTTGSCLYTRIIHQNFHEVDKHAIKIQKLSLCLQLTKKKKGFGCFLAKSTMLYFPCGFIKAGLQESFINNCIYWLWNSSVLFL